MKIRKHKGINQKTGKLKKGYRYSGKKLKSGLPKIIKITKKIRNQRGGEYDLKWIKRQVKILKEDLKSGGQGDNPLTGMQKVETEREIRKLIRQHNKSIKIQDHLKDTFSTYPIDKSVKDNKQLPNELDINAQK